VVIPDLLTIRRIAPSERARGTRHHASLARWCATDLGRSCPDLELPFSSKSASYGVRLRAALDAGGNDTCLKSAGTSQKLRTPAILPSFKRKKAEPGIEALRPEAQPHQGS
jgi:hypothetical protein